MQRAVPARRLVLGVAIGGGLVTLVVGVLPFTRFAYRSFEAHIALEAIEAIIAFFAAYLAFGRYRQSGALSDLVLVAALAFLGTANLFFSVVPAVASGLRPDEYSLWGALALRTSACSALCIAAFVKRQARNSGRALIWAGLGIVGLPLLVATALWAAPELPLNIGAKLPPELSARPRITGDLSIVIPQLVQLGLYAAAAAGFTLRAQRTRDETLAWIGAACALGAWARVNFLLFPSIYTQWVYSGDLLRLGTYLLFMVGIAREIRFFWRGLAEAAVLEERRRVARDLHDGLAQEVAFIVAQMKRHRNAADPTLKRVSSAAERALSEARQAIRTLTPEADIPDRVVFQSAVKDIENRSGVGVRLDYAASEELSPDVRHALVRIMQEAVNNASRHSGAEEISVSITTEGGSRLTVTDDGRGFESVDTSNGFGLVSMRERAETIGGHLKISSDPGRGTRVEVTVPSQE